MHLGSFNSNNMYDKYIKQHVCRFNGKANTIVCDFGCGYSSTLINLIIILEWSRPM